MKMQTMYYSYAPGTGFGGGYCAGPVGPVGAFGGPAFSGAFGGAFAPSFAGDGGYRGAAFNSVGYPIPMPLMTLQFAADGAAPAAPASTPASAPVARGFKSAFKAPPPRGVRSSARVAALASQVPCSPISSALSTPAGPATAAGGPVFRDLLLSEELLKAAESYAPVNERPSVLVAHMDLAQALRSAFKATFPDLPFSATMATYEPYSTASGAGPAGPVDIVDDTVLVREAYNLVVLSDSDLQNLRAIGASGALKYLCAALLVIPESRLGEAADLAEESGRLVLHQVVARKGGLCCAAFLSTR